MKDLPTPGGVTRRLIASMLLNPSRWKMEHEEAVIHATQAVTIRVCGVTGTVTHRVMLDGNCVTCEEMYPGPFRRWRLKNAVRRLAAARISKVLP